MLQIPDGHKFGKDYILKSLLDYVTPEVFVPIMVSDYSSIIYYNIIFVM